MSESDILRSIKEWLEWKAIEVIRHNQIPVPLPGGGYRRFSGKKGVSDLLLCLPGGRFGAVEVKSLTGRLSPQQDAFLDRIHALGGVACCVSSVEELEADLREAGVI